MLQHGKRIVDTPIDVTGTDDADDATHPGSSVR
jgi:hypothetical protein